MYRQILIVDDDQTYTQWLKDALECFTPQPVVKVLHRGADLLAWLETSQRPSVIFLDIHLPDISGFELVKVLKMEDSYRTIPIVVLTVSTDKVDVARSYDLGANNYIVKPRTFTQLVSCLDIFSHYWNDIVDTPDRSWLNPDAFNDN